MSAPFSYFSPTSSGDAIMALVLIESSAAMVSYWNDIRKYYLPYLLNAIRVGNPHLSMRICWQTTSQHSNDSRIRYQGSQGLQNVGYDVPNVQFSHLPNDPIMPHMIMNSINTLRSASPPQGATRHLFMVATSNPTNTMTTPLKVQGHPETDPWTSIAQALCQDNIRLHLILGGSPIVNVFEDLHRKAIHLRNGPDIPPWFEVDASRFRVLISGGPHMPIGNEMSRADAALNTSPAANTRDSSTTPSSSSASLPTSPVQHQFAPSPSSRKAKHKGSGPSMPSDNRTPGIVSYLQQKHGLTKKRVQGQRGNSNLPNNRLRAWSPQATASPTERTPGERASVTSHTRYSPITTSSSQTTTSSSTPSSEETRQGRRQYPWILPASLPPLPPSQPSSSTNRTSQAMRSLESMPRRHPDNVTRRVDVSSLSLPLLEPIRSHTAPELPRMSHGWQGHNHHPSSSSVPNLSEGIATHNTSQVSIGSSSYVHPSQALRHSPPVSYQYPSFRNIDNNPSLTSHAQTSPASSDPPDDSEDQPFVITPEYEARANADFEAAVRSGVMQASMSSTVLTSDIANPLTPGHSPAFVPDNSMMPQMYTTASTYTYPAPPNVAHGEVGSSYATTYSQPDLNQTTTTTTQQQYYPHNYHREYRGPGPGDSHQGEYFGRHW
ncbi:hypothetical protein ABKN59_007448 [Abortiporus biennis]